MMVTMPAQLSRCTGDPACPVRFRYGAPRCCIDHDEQDPLRRAREELGIAELAQSAPGDRDGSDGAPDGAPDGAH
jgi:hypothetical protein